jgi:integrase
VLLEQGVHISIVSAMLGHASASFTIDVYGHISAEMTERAAAALDVAFGSDPVH